MLELNAGAIEILELLFFFLQVKSFVYRQPALNHTVGLCLFSVFHATPTLPLPLSYLYFSTASSFVFIYFLKQLTNYGVENIIGDVIYTCATCHAKHF